MHTYTHRGKTWMDNISETWTQIWQPQYVKSGRILSRSEQTLTLVSIRDLSNFALAFFLSVNFQKKLECKDFPDLRINSQLTNTWRIWNLPLVNSRKTVQFVASWGYYGHQKCCLKIPSPFLTGCVLEFWSCFRVSSGFTMPAREGNRRRRTSS